MKEYQLKQILKIHSFSDSQGLIETLFQGGKWMKFPVPSIL